MDTGGFCHYVMGFYCFPFVGTDEWIRSSSSEVVFNGWTRISKSLESLKMERALLILTL